MGDWCGPKSDTDRLKTGVRIPDDQTLRSSINGRRKRNSSPQENLPYLTRRLMGDPMIPGGGKLRIEMTVAAFMPGPNPIQRT